MRRGRKKGRIAKLGEGKESAFYINNHNNLIALEGTGEAVEKERRLIWVLPISSCFTDH
jgi:hypothetical protein